MRLTKSQAVTDFEGRLIRGKWVLDKKHQLTYKTEGSKADSGITARILDVKPNALSVTFLHKRDGRVVTGRVIRLNGLWSLDSKNRIRFEVKRSSGRSDILKFNNIWSVNGNQQIIYNFTETTLKTRKKFLRTLTFKGYWDIREKNRLTYLITGSSDSQFKVRGTFQTPSVLAKKGEIRFQYGVEFEKKIRTQNLKLFGKWKYSRRLGLGFEIRYGRSDSKRIDFKADYHFDTYHQLSLRLRSAEGLPVGITLSFDRKFLNGDGKAFVELIRSGMHSEVKAGLKFKW